MIEPEVVKKAALDAAEGKLKRQEVFNSLTKFDETYDFVVAKSVDPNYRPCEDNVHQIIDGACRKKREIEKPTFNPEQILHHMIIETFKPILLNGLYEQVYGCLPKRVYFDKNEKAHIKQYGPHDAVKQLRKWVCNGKKIYVCEADIHHAYASVHIGTLCRMLKRIIKDNKWLNITFKFLHYYEDDPNKEEEKGLILGHYTSPWFFNFYLKQFDHYMTSIKDIKYMRFADNIWLVGSNKRKMQKAFEQAQEYLKNNLLMEFNSNYQIYRFEYYDEKINKVRGRAVNALGAIIHYNRVTLRKTILQGIRRKALKINKKIKNKEKVTWHDAASMLSRLAYIRWTNTYNYYLKYIKPLINIKKLKQKIRNFSKAIQPISKERRKIIYDRMEKSTRLSRNST